MFGLDESDLYNGNGFMTDEEDEHFEQTLREFRERLDEGTRKAAKKGGKLVPNVSSDWLQNLKEKIKGGDVQVLHLRNAIHSV